MKNQNELMLYVHWPFCARKCRYCDFLSGPPDSPGQVSAYRDALIAEIKKEDNHAGAGITSVYFGGGTPSLVPVEDTEAVMDALRRQYDFDAADEAIERTIEVNPGAVTKEKLKSYWQMGFNRLSIGCQSTDDRLLKNLGRVHTHRDFLDTAADAVAAGFSNISVDLMIGLPGQTVGDVKTAVREVTALPGVRHLSCYSLIIEEGTPFAEQFARGELILPDEDTERDMAHGVTEEAQRLGFAQYEISNYARAGFESRHNNGYWRFASYRGFGAGAASFDGARLRRFANAASVSGYIRGAALSEDRLLSEDEARGDFMFLGLRRLAGVDEGEYRARFGRDLFDDYAGEIDELLKAGLIIRGAKGIRLSEKGLDFANRVFMAFV